ncbi:MAG: helix-turn-helix transcriptional regulator [Cytophagales bacterium]|nr:helix-turn-helix transcriptional regulator [Cytophagales bacterium]
MNPHDNTSYQRVAKAMLFIQNHLAEPPSLARLAQQVHLSPYHFQREFVRWAGISPLQFAQALRLIRAKALLMQPFSVEKTSQSLGLSGGSRLHDLFLRWEAMSPGEV